MLKTKYRREVHKEKYERSHIFEDPEEPGVTEERSSSGPSEGTASRGWESLQELNERFARYISRARVLEQRNAVFRKQLETLRRMEEAPGLEEAFSLQINLHRQRLRELSNDRTRLEREKHVAECALEDSSNRYRNECEYQQQLRGTLEQLNKEADAALLGNLEYQIQSQFLQDDINSTRDRHKKNLAEIQTYVKILNQIKEMPHMLPNISPGVSEEQVKVLAQRRVPSLQSQLEEYKSALCQLRAQKQELRGETTVLEHAIKTTQDSYDDEIQQYNEQIEVLRKEIDDAERSLEKYTNECRRLAVYQASLENELERYKRIIESEDTRLNSAIIGTPVVLLTTDFRYTPSPSVTSRGRDITQAMHDISNIKPRQKKVLKRKEIAKDVTDSATELKVRGEQLKTVVGDNEEHVEEEHSPLHQTVAPEDVPDGAQISKALDTLCNIIRDRMYQYTRPEPIADFYTKGRYVLVSGESSYMDPWFCSSSPSGGRVCVSFCNDMMPPDYLYRGSTPTPTPVPIPPTPADPEDRETGHGTIISNKGNGSKGRCEGDSERGDHTNSHGVPQPCPSSIPEPIPTQPSCPGHHRSRTPKGNSCWRGHGATPSSSMDLPVDSMSYEKVEVVESTEKISGDNMVRGYEETATIVETTIEKTSKKKHAGHST